MPCSCSRSLALAPLSAALVLGAAVLGQAGRSARPEPPATQPATRPAGEANPAAPGFDREGSDAKAIEIADRVMAQMGGRAAWDETRYLTWNFFGRRFHAWDKQTDTIRVEIDRGALGKFVVVTNLRTRRGQVWKNGEPETESFVIGQMLQAARDAWTNDAYWMFMPYKLKDSGVTLRYRGVQETAEGKPAEVLELTFTDVGSTPGNMYRVYVGRDSGLVEQWDYYKTATQERPSLSTPWTNWKKYGRILLSDDRGSGRILPDVGAFDELPEAVFTSPDPVDVAALKGG